MKRMASLALMAVLLATTAACGGTKGGAASKNEPLRIAYIESTSGPVAQLVQAAKEGAQFAADQANADGGVDGHRVELSFIQTDGTPASTVAAVRKAVTQKGIRFIAGIFSSPEQIAVQPLLKSLGAVDFSYVSDDILREKLCSPNAFMTSPSSTMSIQAIAKGVPAADLRGAWAISAEDASSGHLAVENFSAAVKAAGGTVKTAQYSPQGTTDFGPQIAKLRSSGADHLLVAQYGADGIAFVKQGAQFGLFKQMKAVVGSNTISDPLFPAMGDTVVGFYNDMRYDFKVDTPLNKAFVAAWKDKHGNNPDFLNAGNFAELKVLFAGVDAAHSVDASEVTRALNGLEMDSIYGTVTMRAADHQLLLPTYVGQVIKTASGLGWKVVASLPPTQTTPSASDACEMSNG